MDRELALSTCRTVVTFALHLKADTVNVLVVDDDLDLCTILSRFLERNGCQVHSASDALQALDVLDRCPISLVITDYQMPHMDGVRFTEALRADPRFRNLPVIMLTGHMTSELSDKSLRRGVAFALEKPVDFDRLLTLVRFAE